MKCKRLLSLLVAFAMVFSMLPMSALATNDPLSEENIVEPAPVVSAPAPVTGTFANGTWTLDTDGTLTITGSGAIPNYGSPDWGSEPAPWYDYAKDITAVVISSGITEIGACSFMGCWNLTTVSIPNTVTRIGAHSFENCESLEAIVIPEGVTTIEAFAFSHCPITSVILPASLTVIDGNPFAGCWGLESVSVAAGNTAFAVGTDGALYTTDGKTLVLVPQGMVESEETSSFTVPTGVEVIGDGAFQYISMLCAVTLPTTLKTIEINAFANCMNLNELVIPEGVTYIGDAAFSCCFSLGYTDETISFPSTLEYIGEAAFADTYCLKFVDLSHTKLTHLGNRAFAGEARVGYPALLEIDLPATVTTIGSETFSNCVDLNRIDMPGVQTIGERAFANCIQLRDVWLPASVTSIDAEAFADSFVSAVIFYGSAPAIAADAFANVDAIAYYDGNDTSWNSSNMVDYGGNLEWRADNGVYVLNRGYTAKTSIGGYVELFVEAIPDVSYAWQTSSDNGVTWEDLPGTGALLSRVCRKITEANQNNLFRCVVTDKNDGTLVQYSRIIDVDASLPTIDLSGMLSLTLDPQEVVEYTFTPEMSCTYSFVFESDRGFAADLYSTRGNHICSIDPWGENAKALDSDETYILRLWNYNTQETVDLQVGIIHTNCTETSWVSGDCTTPYKVTYQCDDCGETVNFTGSVGNHSFDCEEHGIDGDTGYCSGCGLGKIGQNVYYTIDKTTGKLTVTGSGDMDCCCWDDFRGLVTEVELSDDITSIAPAAFRDFFNLKTVTIPSACNHVCNEIIESSNVETVIFTGDAPAIDDNAFSRGSTTVPLVHVFYPMDKAGWTEDVLQQYGGNVAWHGYNSTDKVLIPKTVTVAPFSEIVLPVVDPDGLISSIGWTKDSNDFGFAPAAGNDIVVSVPSSGSCVVTAEVTYLDNTTETFQCTITVESPSIEVGQIEVVKSVQNGYVYVTFVPEQTCRYEVQNFGPWMYAVIKDADGNVLDTGYPGDETVYAAMTAGETYLIGVEDPDGEADIELYVLLRHYDFNFDYEQSLEPDCYNDGYDYFECTDCDAVWTEVRGGGHGYTDGYCDRCGEEQIEEGSCGPNAEFRFSFVTRHLEITGSGEMTEAPWLDFCHEIKSVAIGSGITTICDYAFEYCEALEEVTIPDSVTRIGYGAFYYCTALQDVVIPNGVKELADEAFSCCFSLKDITIPDSVKSIGFEAFTDCYNLRTVTLGSGVERIENRAFSYCEGLRYMIIPASVTYMGMEVFWACSDLQTLVFEGEIPGGEGVLAGLWYPVNVYYYGSNWGDSKPSYWYGDAITYIDIDAPVVLDHSEKVIGRPGKKVTFNVHSYNAVEHHWMYSPNGSDWYPFTSVYGLRTLSETPAAPEAEFDGGILTVTVTEENVGYQYKCVLMDENENMTETEPMSVTVLPTLQENGTVNFTLEGDEVAEYSFTPSATTVYNFNLNDSQAEVTVFDQNGEEIGRFNHEYGNCEGYLLNKDEDYTVYIRKYYYGNASMSLQVLPATVLTLAEEGTVTLPYDGSQGVFSFTPEQTGNYSITWNCTPDYGTIWYGNLPGYNWELYTLEAGTTYYLYAYNYYYGVEGIVYSVTVNSPKGFDGSQIETGTSLFYTAEEDGWYTVTIPSEVGVHCNDQYGNSDSGYNFPSGRVFWMNAGETYRLAFYSMVGETVTFIPKLGPTEALIPGGVDTYLDFMEVDDQCEYRAIKVEESGFYYLTMEYNACSVNIMEKDGRYLNISESGTNTELYCCVYLDAGEIYLVQFWHGYWHDNEDTTVTLKVSPEATSIQLSDEIVIGRFASTTIALGVEPIYADRTATWSVGDDSIVYIDMDSAEPGRCRIIGLRPGETTLTATNSNGLTATATVRVEESTELELDTLYEVSSNDWHEENYYFIPEETGYYLFTTRCNDFDLSVSSDGDWWNYRAFHEDGLYYTTYRLEADAIYAVSVTGYDTSVMVQACVEKSLSLPETLNMLAGQSLYINAFDGYNSTQHVEWYVDEEFKESGIRYYASFDEAGEYTIKAERYDDDGNVVETATCTVTVKGVASENWAQEGGYSPTDVELSAGESWGTKHTITYENAGWYYVTAVDGVTMKVEDRHGNQISMIERKYDADELSDGQADTLYFFNLDDEEYRLYVTNESGENVTFSLTVAKCAAPDSISIEIVEDNREENFILLRSKFPYGSYADLNWDTGSSFGLWSNGYSYDYATGLFKVYLGDNDYGYVKICANAYEYNLSAEYIYERAAVKVWELYIGWDRLEFYDWDWRNRELGYTPNNEDNSKYVTFTLGHYDADQDSWVETPIAAESFAGDLLTFKVDDPAYSEDDLVNYFNGQDPAAAYRLDPSFWGQESRFSFTYKGQELTASVFTRRCLEFFTAPEVTLENWIPDSHTVTPENNVFYFGYAGTTDLVDVAVKKTVYDSQDNAFVINLPGYNKVELEPAGENVYRITVKESAFENGESFQLKLQVRYDNGDGGIADSDAIINCLVDLSDLDGMDATVVHEDGTETKVLNLNKAVEEAQSGETIKLNANTETVMVMVPAGITLDLNGWTLTANYLAADFAGAQVVDNSSLKTGKLQIQKGYANFNANNPQMPIWTGDGFVFATMKMQARAVEYSNGGNTLSWTFRPSFGTMFNAPYFADGGLDNGITIGIRMTWDTVDAEGNILGSATQDFVAADSLVATRYAGTGAFVLTVNGIRNAKNLKLCVMVSSDKNVVVTDNHTVVNSQN